MLTPAPKEENDRQFNALLHSGFLEAAYYGVQDGSGASFDNRHRFFHSELNERTRGDDRWQYVDEHLGFVADRFGFEKLWIRTGFYGHPKMLMLRRENLVISAHQLDKPTWAPRYAKYRRALMPERSQRLIYTLEEIIGETPVLEPTHDYWTLTYERTHDRLPRWVTFGRPVRDERKLYYARDLGTALGIIHPADIRIEMNPSEEQLRRQRFRPQPTDKPEGEGNS